MASQDELCMKGVQGFDGFHTVLVTVTSHKIVYTHVELFNDIDIAQCCYYILALSNV